MSTITDAVMAPTEDHVTIETRREDIPTWFAVVDELIAKTRCTPFEAMSFIFRLRRMVSSGKQEHVLTYAQRYGSFHRILKKVMKTRVGSTEGSVHRSLELYLGGTNNVVTLTHSSVYRPTTLRCTVITECVRVAKSN